MKKIYRRRGESRLVVIMAVIVVVLAFFAVVPAVRNFSAEKVRQAEDEKYEEAAKRAALIEQNSSGGVFVMVYDGAAKRFVKPKDAMSVAPYGGGREHEGKVILYTSGGTDGQGIIRWLTPEEIVTGQY